MSTTPCARKSRAKPPAPNVGGPRQLPIRAARVALVGRFLLGHVRASRAGIIASAAPGLIALGLFYSLAIHMRQSLGKWPTSIGERGFPPALLTHATAATTYFWIYVLLSIFALPVAILVCLFFSRWRHLVPYFALYAFVFIGSIVLMQFAPEPFLYWWKD